MCYAFGGEACGMRHTPGGFWRVAFVAWATRHACFLCKNGVQRFAREGKD